MKDRFYQKSNHCSYFYKQILNTLLPHPCGKKFSLTKKKKLSLFPGKTFKTFVV